MVKEKKRSSPGLKPLTEGSKKKAIEEAAYFRWLSRNREPGKELDDWLGAERELMGNIFDRDVEG